MAIALGFLSAWWLNIHDRNMKKSKREITNFDTWSVITWKAGIVIGFSGGIILIIELINTLLPK